MPTIAAECAAIQDIYQMPVRVRWQVGLVLLSALCLNLAQCVDISNICCFQDNDVRVERLGNSSSMLIVNGFFCPAFLDFVQRFAASATRHATGDTSSFPGWRVPFGQIRENKGRLEDIKRSVAASTPDATPEFFDALLQGHYLKCITKAVAVADFQIFPASIFKSGLGHESGLAMITRKPSPFSNLHIDPGMAVVNIHLSDGFENTSSAFYRAHSGQEQCVGDAEAMRTCRNLIDEHITFSVIHDQHLSQQSVSARCKDTADHCAEQANAGRCSSEAQRMHQECKSSCGVCGGLWLGPHVPAAQDHAGLFHKYHEVAYQRNRLTLYSGHLFHSPYISRDALAFIEATQQVRFKRKAGQGLGMDLESSDEGATRVRQLLPGAVAAWNVRHPRQAVLVGSYVLEVNGQRGATAVLERALASSTSVVMLVTRRGPNDITPNASGRLMLQHFVPDPASTEHAVRYSETEGVEGAVARLQGMGMGMGGAPSSVAVSVDPVTHRLLRELSAVGWLPDGVLQSVRSGTKTPRPDSTEGRHEL